MRGTVASVALLVLAVCAFAQTSVPTLMNYQGRLTATSGAPLPDGQYKLTFRLFGQLSGGTQTWYQTMDPVVVRNGVFAVLLGSGAPLTEAMFTGTTFLEVQVGDAAPLTPRQPIVSVAYAMKAERAKVADTVPTGSISTAMLADGAVTTPKLADGAVTSAKMMAGSVSSAQLANDYSSFPKVSGGALAVSGSGGVSLTAGLGQLFGCVLGDAFQWDGRPMGNYALSWMPTTGGAALWLSGYSGIRLFTGAANTVSVDVEGNTTIIGNLEVFGNLKVRSPNKLRVVATKTYGDRAMYAFESTENRFLDQGRARLINGSATVKLDPMFLQTVEGDYLIHLTPYADASLYVAQTGRGAFTVKCRRGDRNAQFVWQLSAWSKGGKGMRMRQIEGVAK